MSASPARLLWPQEREALCTNVLPLKNLHGNQHNNEGLVRLSQCTLRILRHSSDLLFPKLN